MCVSVCVCVCLWAHEAQTQEPAPTPKGLVGGGRRGIISGPCVCSVWGPKVGLAPRHGAELRRASLPLPGGSRRSFGGHCRLPHSGLSRMRVGVGAAALLRGVRGLDAAQLRPTARGSSLQAQPSYGLPTWSRSPSAPRPARTWAPGDPTAQRRRIAPSERARAEGETDTPGAAEGARRPRTPCARARAARERPGRPRLPATDRGAPWAPGARRLSSHYRLIWDVRLSLNMPLQKSFPTFF